ncbi:hypothetical protein CJF60_03555 [Mycoplasmopsis agassizii]|uniref:Type I restriction modification DNA specificity domain-containing protein n=3 Tax=Mycoplasmopsis agassizii TaxID=33922 RepID=A0ABX4H587_9BACT|nr:hypothetical protein CJF60_03555 [Mycoplasmopsis agassizii]
MRNLDYKITASNYQSHWEAYSQIEIPLPSLEIQNKIVSILDEFSRLEARNKQYNYYLHHLLNFEGEKSDNTEWIKLDDLIDYIQPTKFIVKSDEYKNQYETPVLTAGKTFVLGYTNEKEGIYNASKENPVIIFDDFTTSMHWVDFDFKIKSSAMKILVSKNNKNNFRYIYYAMKVIDYEISKSDHQRHWISKYSQIEIPVPSLEEQNRIVNILDKFSKLTSDINEGLPAEIKMRRQQYEYYREKLLTFSQ